MLQVFPDKPEKRRASQLFKAAFDSIDGISIGSLDDIPGTSVCNFFRSIRSTLDFDFEDGNEGSWEPKEPPTLYMFINCSTRELSVIEKFVESFASSTPTLLFNLELDTLRYCLYRDLNFMLYSISLGFLTSGNSFTLVIRNEHTSTPELNEELRTANMKIAEMEKMQAEQAKSQAKQAKKLEHLESLLLKQFPGLVTEPDDDDDDDEE